MRFMIILAVLLAPLGMIGGTPAYAAAKQAPPGAMRDCAGMQKQSKDEPAQSRDCMMACAAILQASSEINANPLAPRAAAPVALTTTGHGLEPEAETPPPRPS